MPANLPRVDVQSSLSDVFSNSKGLFLKLNEPFSKSKDVFPMLEADVFPNSEDVFDLFPISEEFVSEFPVVPLLLRQDESLVEVSIL